MPLYDVVQYKFSLEVGIFTYCALELLDPLMHPLLVFYYGSLSGSHLATNVTLEDDPLMNAILMILEVEIPISCGEVTLRAI